MREARPHGAHPDDGATPARDTAGAKRPARIETPARQPRAKPGEARHLSPEPRPPWRGARKRGGRQGGAGAPRAHKPRAGPHGAGRGEQPRAPQRQPRKGHGGAGLVGSSKTNIAPAGEPQNPRATPEGGLGCRRKEHQCLDRGCGARRRHAVAESNNAPMGATYLPADL